MNLGLIDVEGGMLYNLYSMVGKGQWTKQPTHRSARAALQKMGEKGRWL